MRSIPRGTAPKLILAGVAAALLAPIATPLIARRAATEAAGALGNFVLGMLGDTGKSKLGDLITKILKTNKGRSENEVRDALAAGLADELTAVHDGAEALRLEVVELFGRFDAVEVAIQEARDSTRDEIAHAFGELAAQFSEFESLAADVRAGLELVMETQSQQLALQYEQLELQRQQTSKLNLLIATVETRDVERHVTRQVAPADVDGSRDATVSTPPIDVPCPYQGLLPFQADDSELFFGRDILVAELLTRFGSERFVAILGPSGSGKSSVVRAGLLPRLGTGSVPGSSSWPAPIVLTPGRRPVEQLAMRLGARRPTHDGAAIRRQLLDDPSSIRVIVGQQLDDADEQVIVVDQFEELFTLEPDAAERTAFIDCLVAAADSARVRVVVALRADYLGACATSPELLRAIQDHQVLVSPMSEPELRDVIERPAERVGSVVEPRLVELMVHDVLGEPGALPLLSHALAATWDRREGNRLTVNGYLAAGGVRGAIAATADAIVSAMPPDDQATTRSIMLRLTNLSGEVPTRSRVDRAELLTLGTDPARVEDVLGALTHHRLVTGDEGTVEVAHEAVLREWKQLRGWIDEDRLGLALRQDVTARAAAWNAGGRSDDDLLRGARLTGSLEYRDRYGADLTDLEESYIDSSRKFEVRSVEAERRRARRFQLVAAGTGLLALIAGLITVVAFQQRSRADDQRDRADEAAVVAEGERDRADAAATLAGVRRLASESEAARTRSPDLSALLALEADRLGPDTVESVRQLAALGISSLPARRTFAEARVGGVGIVRGGDAVVVYGATAGSDLLPVSHVRVLDVATGHTLLDVDAPNGIFAIAPDGDAARIANAREAWRVDLRTGDTSVVALQGAEAGVTPTASDSGAHVVAILADGTLRVWDTVTGEAVTSIAPPESRPAFVAVTEAGDMVATVDQAGNLAMYDAGGTQLWSWFVGQLPQSVRFDHRGDVIAVAGAFGTLLYDAATGQLRGSIAAGAHLGSKLAFSADDTTIAVASAGQIGRWNTNSMIGVGSPVPIGNAFANGLAFGSTHDELVVNTSSGDVTLLRFGGGSDGSDVLLQPLTVGTVAAFTSNTSLIARHDGSRLEVVESGSSRAYAGGPQVPATAVAVTEQGDRVAVGVGSDAWLFELGSGQVIDVPVAPAGESTVRGLVFSPDGDRMATSLLNGDGTVGVAVFGSDGSPLWSLEPSLLLAPSAVGGLQWAPDGTLGILRIAASDVRPVVEFHAADTGDLVGTTALGEASTDFPTTLQFGTTHMVIGTNAGRVDIYELGSTEAPRSLVAPSGFQTVASIAYDEKAAAVVAADLSGQLVGWMADDADPLFGPIQVQQTLAAGSLTTIALTPAADGLIVGDVSGGVRRLPWGREAWRDSLCEAAGRNLTQAEWARFLPAAEPYHATCPGFPAGN